MSATLGAKVDTFVGNGVTFNEASASIAMDVVSHHFRMKAAASALSEKERKRLVKEIADAIVSLDAEWVGPH